MKMRSAIWSIMVAIILIAVTGTQGANFKIDLASGISSVAAGGSSMYYANNSKSANCNFLVGGSSMPYELSKTDGSVVNNYPALPAKSTLQLGSYIYFTHNDGGGIARLDAASWGNVVNWINPTNSAGTDTKAESICTDGTLIFGNDDNDRTNLHAWAVSNTAGDFSLTWQWTASLPAGGRVRGLCYANGYLYASTGGAGADRNIYAINVSDQTVTAVGVSVPDLTTVYGVIRSGDLLMGISYDNLYVWDMTSDTAADPLSVDTYSKEDVLGGQRIYSVNYSTVGRLLIGGATGHVAVYDAAPRSLPLLSGELALKRTMTMSAGSVYNPRIHGGEVYGVDITVAGSVNRFELGSTTPDASKDLGSLPSRMLSSMGGNSKTWVISAGSSETGNDYFRRYDYATMANETVATNSVGDLEPNSFDWVDSDTLISTSYQIRNRLYLFDVVADPFSTTLNTAWNTNGYVDTSAGSRLRNVRVGDQYSGYAYYADSLVVSPTIYALDLATGVETNIGSLTVTKGYAGVWQCKEVDGYMYFHTTDDGIYVYNMTDATTLGTLYTHHTQAQLVALGGSTSYGSDVAIGGQSIILGVGGTGQILELGTAYALPFAEDFESDYVDGDAITSQHLWLGDSSALAASSAAIGGALGGLVPSEASVSNLFMAGSSCRVWTDLNAVPTMWTDATAPAIDATATAIFYINSNGYPVVSDGATWVEKTTTPAGFAIPPYVSGAARATIFHNYGTKSWALFINGVVAADQLGFVNTAASSYSLFAVNGQTEFDDLSIGDASPSGFTADQDADGLIDVWEIQNLDSIMAYDGSDDPDGDGASNAREQTFGTDPLDAGSTPLATGSLFIMR